MHKYVYVLHLTCFAYSELHGSDDWCLSLSLKVLSLLLQIFSSCLAILVPLPLHINFRIIFSM